jgi:hypothetical protein
MTALLSTIPFRWFKGSDGTPAAGYYVEFYEPGTATPKTIYQDDLIPPTPYPSPSNTAILNAEGYANIFLKPGNYKIIIRDELFAQVFELDNIPGGGTSFGTGFVDRVVDPLASGPGLAEVDPAANPFVWCAGYFEKGDGGHGFFWNASSVEPEDGGYVIASTINPAIRWFRVPDESTDVRAASFGYIGTRAEDLTNQLLSAAGYASGHGLRLLIGPGTNASISSPDDSDFVLYVLGGIHFTDDSLFRGFGEFLNMQIFGTVTGTPVKHFEGFQAIFSTPQGNENPEWFGAVADFSFNNTAAFVAWFASGAMAYTLPAGVWGYANTTLLVFPTVPVTLLGSINSTVTGPDIPTGVYFPNDSRFRVGEIVFPDGGTIADGGPNGVQVGGDLFVTGAANVTGNINSDGNISAGVDGQGQIRSHAGTSLDDFAAGGVYGTVASATPTSGTGETDLLSIPIAANAIITNNDKLTITASGTYIGAAGTKTVSVYAGSKFLGGHTAVAMVTGAWKIVLNLYKKAATNYAYDWVFNGISGVTQEFSMNAGESFPVDWATGFNLKVTGQASVGNVVNYALSVEIMPVKA